MDDKPNHNLHPAQSGSRPCHFSTFKSNQQQDLAGQNDQPEQQLAHQHGGPIPKVAPLDLYRQHPSGQKIDCSRMDNDSISKMKKDAPTFVEPFKYAGLFGSMLSVVSFSLSMFCIKLLPVETSIQEGAKACTFRGLCMVIISSIGVLYQGCGFKVAEGEFWVNFIRAISGGVTILLGFVSVQFIDLGERSAIAYIYVIWTALMGYLILKEPLKATLLLIIPLPSMPAIDLAEILRDFSNDGDNNPEIRNKSETLLKMEADKEMDLERRLIGVSAAILASFASAVVVIVLKFRKRTPIVTCTFYQALSLVVISVSVQTVVGFGSVPTSPVEWTLHFLIGFLSWLSHYLKQWSLQFLPAIIYSIIQSFDIVLGFFLGVVLLNEPLLWTSVIGSFLIVFMVVILMSDEFLMRKLKQLFS